MKVKFCYVKKRGGNIFIPLAVMSLFTYLTHGASKLNSFAVFLHMFFVVSRVTKFSVTCRTGESANYFIFL